MNIIITGGTRGLGLSHAFYLSNKGYNLALVDISRKACQVYGEIKNVNDLLLKLSFNGTKNKFYEEIVKFNIAESSPPKEFLHLYFVSLLSRIEINHLEIGIQNPQNFRPRSDPLLTLFVTKIV